MSAPWPSFSKAWPKARGLLCLLGAPGVGKTLLIHCLLERLGPGAATAFLTNGHFRGPSGLLQTILYDLSLPYEGRGEQEMRLTVTDHLLKHFGAEQKPVVLIVDEAQHLDADLLEELRMLANLEAPGGRAVQVVLVGQPSLLENLRRPELAALWQRIAARAELGALSLEEAADYLLHHLRSAGVRPEDLFSDEAVELVARGALGVPRLLNQAAHKALALAAEAGADTVDAEAALEALAALGLETEAPPETAGRWISDEVFPRINGQAHAGLQG